MKDILLTVSTFLRSILLDDIQPSILKANAIDLLLKITKVLNDPATIQDSQSQPKVDPAYYLDRLKIAFEHGLKGEKIQAIKVIREATGWGLKESKDWVDVNLKSVTAETIDLHPSGGAAYDKSIRLNREVASTLLALYQCNGETRTNAIGALASRVGWSTSTARRTLENLNANGLPRSY